MANTKISALTSGSALALTDIFPAVETAGTGPVQKTGATLASGLLGSSVLSGQTVTTSNPVLNLSQTWNAGAVAFTGLKFNATDTASAATSLLLDLQVGGSSKFNVDKSGVVKINGGGTMTWTSADSLVFSSTGGYQRILAYTMRDTNNSAGIGNAGVAGGTQVHLAVSSELGWTTGSSVATGTYDLRLARDAANTLALRNSTNAQAFNVYNTYTDASNYERGVFDWSTNANWLTVGTVKAGTGTNRGIVLNSATNIVAWGGTTSSFPAIKRNAAAINFRLADDSADAAITASTITTSSTTLHTTSVALSNGAGAGAGTLTNAPSAGNPTKWIPINDNGTTRYIPAW